MARMLRTFVATRCGAEVAARLREASSRLAALDRALRIPSADEYHVTIQFLGDTREEDVPPLGEALGRVAAEFAPFEVRYRGLGAFPSAPRARVVWAGFAGDVAAVERFASLARAVGTRLGPLGYAPEARRFHPHVTLGRVRRRPSPDLVRAVEAGATQDLGREEVSDLKLILSEPGDRGYRYIDLTTVALGTGPSEG